MGRASKGIFASVVLCLSACSPKQSPTAPRPLVLVPGMIGSSLVDAKERGVWGNRSVLRVDFTRLALPTSEWFAQDALKAGKVLGDLPVVPLAYSLDQYGGVIEALEKGGYKLGETLIPYAYDWRQDVPAEGLKLRKFLQELSLKHSIIDIYAISLGGLITMEALAEWNFTGLEVKHLVLAGTPLLGSPTVQRMFHWPRRSGVRVSAKVPTETAITMRSLYYLLPEQRLNKLLAGKDEDDAEFRYGKNLSNNREPAKVQEIDWMDPRVYALAPKIAAEGLERAAAWRRRWNEPHRFPIVRRGVVFGSSCIDTFGMPGDNTVLAASIRATANAFNSAPFWLCEKHEKLHSARTVTDNLLQYSKE